jgi:hypothetical protein
MSLSSRERSREERASGKEAPSPRTGIKASPIITLSGDETDPIYIARMLNRDCLRQKSVSIRSSISWIECHKTPNGGLAIPFIDQLGRFTGHTVYKWSCDPRSLIATVTSTIAKRLLRYARKHNKGYLVRRHSRLLLESAAYYAMTKNSHFWDRVLYFARDLATRSNLIHRTRLFFSSRWSDSKRFVYSQVTFQTNWLLFRAFRPRDKLQFYRSGWAVKWRNPLDAPSLQEVTNEVRDIAYAMSLV